MHFYAVDPLAQLSAKIAALGAAAPRIRAKVVGELRQAIDQRFARGQAPVASGHLRASVKVSEQGDAVSVSSDLPYAQFHPEIMPSEQELDAIVKRAADQEIS